MITTEKIIYVFALGLVVTCAFALWACFDLRGKKI